MTALTRWTAPLSLVLLGGLVAVGPAAAQNTRPVPLGGVKDGAALFSDEAVQKARKQIAEIKRTLRKDLVIETFAKPPAAYEGMDRKKFVPQWAAERFDELRVDGVYVLICKDPSILRVQVGKNTMKQGEFTSGERNELAQLMLKRLRASKETKADAAEAQKLRDQALLDGVAYVRDNMAPAPAPRAAAAPPGRAHEAPAEEPRSFLSTYGGWICLGLVALLVVWLIFGVIRGLSNRGSPGYGGGGGGGYGGGGGGGGGGFFTSLLGGMFGAAAGMWMYSHFFGGNTPSAGASGPMGGGADPYQSDVGAGSEGTGGDWDGGGGGDAGGGDAGGGGDWGGGGGDAGGGGGDAGGGGGDWGGGGGDWGGGGGGGGDWGGGGGGGGGGDW